MFVLDSVSARRRRRPGASRASASAFGLGVPFDFQLALLTSLTTHACELLRLGLRNLSFVLVHTLLKYYTLSSWRIAAFNSILLPRECQTLTHTYAHTLGNQSKCRPSSTTRCRRRCEVSTSWTDPISTYFGGSAWRKMQQRVGYVAVERFKSIR
jgi:hypothetical protein